MRKIMLFFLVQICLTPAFYCAHAAKIWVNPKATSGFDGQTKQTGFKTLWTGLKAMKSGDQLIIANGDWRQYPDMVIAAKQHLPPSGTGYDNMSVVRAETDWGVYLPYAEDQGIGREYVMIRGIVFLDKGGIFTFWHHSKIIRCGFRKPKQAGNHTTFSFMSGSYNLAEECIAWGGGRYKIKENKSSNNIFRRCVARHDWYISPEWHGQESNFRGYGAKNSAWQNCISIDSDREQYQEKGSREDGDFWVGDQSGAGGNIIEGCMVIRGMYQGYYICGPTGRETVTVLDSVALGPALEGVRNLTGGITVSVVAADLRNLLVTGYNKGNQHFLINKKQAGSISISDSIAANSGRLWGNTISASRLWTYKMGEGDFGRDAVEKDPLENGLWYPVRLEENTPLAKGGGSGKPYGPTIMYRIGEFGKCRDEKGWDKKTRIPLWPFPNENIIQKLFTNTVPGVDGEYGFCEPGQTLTHYVWGYFGRPVPPFNLRAEVSDKKVSLLWDPPAPLALPTITGFKVYNVTNGSSTLYDSVPGNRTFTLDVKGLKPGLSYSFCVTAVYSDKGESKSSYPVAFTMK